MIEKLEKVLEPVANKLAQQRHLQAISSGMMMPLGLIVIGSLFFIDLGYILAVCSSFENLLWI